MVVRSRLTHGCDPRPRFNDSIEPMTLANMRRTTRGLFSQLRRESGDFVAPVITTHPTSPVALSFQAALHTDGVPMGQPAPEEERRDGKQDDGHRPSKVCSGFHSLLPS
jgi:hypothetical protein